MSNPDGLLNLERVEQPANVGDQVLDGVALSVRGCVAAAEAALVGRDHPEAGVYDRPDADLHQLLQRAFEWDDDHL